MYFYFLLISSIQFLSKHWFSLFWHGNSMIINLIRMKMGQWWMTQKNGFTLRWHFAPGSTYVQAQRRTTAVVFVSSVEFNQICVVLKQKANLIVCAFVFRLDYDSNCKRRDAFFLVKIRVTFISMRKSIKISQFNYDLYKLQFKYESLA